uniref:Uncharacterized protein n=1 Tax=Salix viminalis TaxID=40686 RepID=A0A6N2LQE6_SALVM
MESRRMQINIRIGISYQDQNFVDDACFGLSKMATAKYLTSSLLCFDPKAKWMLVQCPLQTMVFCAHRVLILLICIGFIAVQPDEVYGLTSVELVLRHNQKDQGTVPQNQRVLKDVDMQGMDIKKSAHASKTFDRSQSSKRGVRRGSDPIHNRASIISVPHVEIIIQPPMNKEWIVELVLKHIYRKRGIGIDAENKKDKILY